MRAYLTHTTLTSALGRGSVTAREEQRVIEAHADDEQQ